MNADRLAEAYRWVEYAAFGGALERCRYERLAELAAARRVLVLGEGDGRFAARLLRENGAVQVVVMESSARMIRVAQRRLGESVRVEWRMGDVLAAAWPEGPFDAVVTHSGFLRWLARAWLGVMYLFFRWTAGLRANRLPDWEGLLHSAGFRCQERRRWRWGLVASEVWRKEDP